MIEVVVLVSYPEGLIDTHDHMRIQVTSANNFGAKIFSSLSVCGISQIKIIITTRL